MNKTILMGSDHAGFEMKQELVKYVKTLGFEVKDIGTDTSKAVDYPDYGHQLGEMIGNGKFDTAISICGSGNGINMTTNKHKGVRGALCWNVEISEMSRRHNDANICSIPARYLDLETAKEIVKTFLETEFDGGRHERRIKKIDI